MRRAMQKCLRSASRSTTASSAMAGLSPRADMAALRAKRAVVIRCAFGLEVSDRAFDDIGCFPFVVEVSTRKEKPAGKAAGSPRTWSGGNGQHGLLERAAPLIPLRGRLEQRERLAHHERRHGERIDRKSTRLN